MPTKRVDSQKFNEIINQEFANVTQLDNIQKTELIKVAKTALDDSSKSPLETDIWIYRLVVIIIGLVLLLSVSGILFIYNEEGKKIPETLTALGSGALGAFAGLLAPSPRQKD